jgi:hypothetical protein
MRSIIGWLCAWIAGAAGWWLGERLGIVTAVLLSALSAAAGLYAGFRWHDQHLK